MGILTNIVAAEDDEIEAVGASQHPVEEWSGVEMRGIDTAKIATLHSLLTGDLFDDAIACYEPLDVATPAGVALLRLDAAAAARLAELDEEVLDAVAAELAATEEFEQEGWADETIAAMLADLAELARLAESQGQVLFVWMHPLRT